jgi:BTB/POZ domain
LTLVADSFDRPFTSEVVRVIGGTEPQGKFNVHSDIICAASSFFTTCLNDGMPESHTKVVNLPGEDPNAFALIINMLYDINPNPTPSCYYGFVIDCKTIIIAYILADKLCMEREKRWPWINEIL